MREHLNEAALTQWAEELAPRLPAGTIILLQGDLGMGKSVFARALIRALAPQSGDIPSPTFTLVQAYDLPQGGQLLHYDLYRLEDPEEIWELGWEDAGNETQITLVEWPERLGVYWPDHCYHVMISPERDADLRHVTIHPPPQDS